MAAPTRTFGPVAGVAEGAMFASRAELSRSGVHAPLQAGISGRQEEGANSVVLTGGAYEDDEDFGDEVIYTGHGGRSQKTGEQIADQTLTLGNLALARNCLSGHAVRLVRGVRGARASAIASKLAYRYDGLFRVEEYWQATGRSGHRVWCFRLRKLPPTETAPVAAQAVVREDEPVDAGPPRRTEATVLRIIRDTTASRGVKRLYDFTCQMCGERLETLAGPYAEAAHIRPLGRPHAGPDVASNLLCLCPNHHAQFDLGGVGVAEDFSLINLPGRSLHVLPRHRLDRAQLRHHRERFGLG